MARGRADSSERTDAGSGYVAPPDGPCSVPLEMEDGTEVVICQSNVGADNMVGSGEFPDPSSHPTVEDAAAQQLELEDEAPTRP